MKPRTILIKVGFYGANLYQRNPSRGDMAQ